MPLLKPLCDHVLGSPRLYDRVQRLFGLRQLRARVAAVLSELEPGTLLDVGAGTANFYRVLPLGLDYTALDVDERKLARGRAKFPELRTLLGDGVALPLNDADVDYTLCVDVSHHLRDDELDRFVAELARVTRRKLVFVDALSTSRLTSKLLWTLDRGSFPRPMGIIQRALEQRFTFERLEVFSIQHSYLLAVCAPKRQ